MKKLSVRNKNLIINAVFLTVIAALFVLDTVRRYVYGGSCLIKDVTGTPCPACGMTRAYFSLLRFDFASAFRYNPAFPTFPVSLLLLLLVLLKPKRKKLWLVLFFLDIAALIAVWIVRIATGTIANAL